jgi:hypothetical protein
MVVRRKVIGEKEEDGWSRHPRRRRGRDLTEMVLTRLAVASAAKVRPGT